MADQIPAEILRSPPRGPHASSRRPRSRRTRSSATSASTPTPSATPRRSGPASRASWNGRARGTRVLDWQPPHAKWFVGGQLNVSVNCLDRHVRDRAPQQGRAHLGRRARRPPHAHLLRPLPRGLGVRQRPQVARHQEGRPRRALPADDPRAGHRDARLRAHRRRPQRRLRRLQRRVAARPHQRRAGAAARSPPTAATGAARSSRSSRSPTRRSPTRRRSSTSSSCSAAPGRCPCTSRKGATTGTTALMQDAALDVRRRADGRRGHALHPLHVGHDREAQGHRPHDRRLPGRRVRDDQAASSTCTTTTSTGAPRTSAG